MWLIMSHINCLCHTGEGIQDLTEQKLRKIEVLRATTSEIWGFWNSFWFVSQHCFSTLRCPTVAEKWSTGFYGLHWCQGKFSEENRRKLRPWNSLCQSLDLYFCLIVNNFEPKIESFYLFWQGKNAPIDFVGFYLGLWLPEHAVK